MKTLCVIPARYASTRFPGKPLADICGKPMIVRVYERAAKAETISGVIVATDDKRIFDAVENSGGHATMTSRDHDTGTDRLAEVAMAFPDADVVVNVQGDEPLIEPSLIDELATSFVGNGDLNMATVITPMTSDEEINDPNNVKVVTDLAGYALYFSRCPIPYERDASAVVVYKHIGIYAYRREFLLRYARMPKTPLERSESLEQLRALENGYRIKCIETDLKFVGVDTKADLKRVNEIYASMNG